MRLVIMLALAAGSVYCVRRILAARSPQLSDDLIKQIEEQGSIDVEEPLDLAQIQEEEERFWEEQPWEEPEEL